MAAKMMTSAHAGYPAINEIPPASSADPSDGMPKNSARWYQSNPATAARKALRKPTGAEYAAPDRSCLPSQSDSN